MGLVRIPTLFVASVLAALTVVGGIAPVVAQDASPAALPATPEASDCTVEPRPISFFEQFVGTPTAMQGTPTAGTPVAGTPAAAFQMPDGVAAVPETVTAVTATVVEVAACLNAGEFLRYFALFTDDYFQGVVEEFGPLPEEELAAFAAEPEALPEQDRAAILAVVEVRVLEDGRVAGLFDVYDPFATPPGPARFYWEFVEEDGRWLIDEEVMLGPIEPDQVGMPAS